MGAPMRHPFRTAVFVVVVVALLAAAWVRVPYYALGPGPAQSVTPLIDYANDEPRYEPTGAARDDDGPVLPALAPDGALGVGDPDLA